MLVLDLMSVQEVLFLFENHTIGDSVYEKIKYDIIHLILAPGEKLSEALLAEKYGVSRAPIRVALRRLQGDGLIVIRPQSGSIVSPISIERALNVIDIRILLEPPSIIRAIPNITDADITYMSELFTRLGIMTPGSPERSRFMSEVDIELHTLIQKRSGNPLVFEILNRYAAEIQRIRRANIQWQNRMIPSEQEMRQIFAAICQRDAETAADAMQVHLHNIRETLLQLPT